MPLVDTNFLRWPNDDSGDKDFDDVIADPEFIGLFFTDGKNFFTDNTKLGFSSSLNAFIYVDNFGAVPIPSAIILLGSGLIGLAGLRRKFKR